MRIAFVELDGSGSRVISSTGGSRQRDMVAAPDQHRVVGGRGGFCGSLYV